MWANQPHKDFFLFFVFDHCPGFLTTILFSPLLSFHLQLLQVSTSWSMRVLPWTCPAPTRPSTLPKRTPPEVARRPRSNPRPRPTLRRSRSSPVSLPSSSPGSCLGRGCPSPSTWSPLCPAPSRYAPTAPCPSTELVWKTGMWFCESWKVEGEGEKNNQIKKNKSIKRQWESLLSHCGSDLSSHRLCRCHREAQLLGLRLLPGPAGTASLPAGAPRRGLASGSPGYSGGGGGEPRPAQPPVEMQRCKSNRNYKNNKKYLEKQYIHIWNK